MGYSKDLSTYPITFAQLYDRAQRENFEMDFEDRGTAQAFIFRLHAYRRAVELANVPGHQNLRNITIRSRGTRVVFDNNKEAMRIIREAVGMAEPSKADLEQYMIEAFDGDTNDEQESTTAGPVPEANSRRTEKSSTGEGEKVVETDYLKLFEGK